MAKSTGALGIGIELQMGDGASPEVFTSIINITNIEGPGVTTETTDATHFGSPNNTREKRAGLLDSEEITFTGHYDPTHATMDTSTGVPKVQKDRSTRGWRILYPMFSRRFTFDGYITKWTTSATPDGLIEVNGAVMPVDGTGLLESYTP